MQSAPPDPPVWGATQHRARQPALWPRRVLQGVVAAISTTVLVVSVQTHDVVGALADTHKTDPVKLIPSKNRPAATKAHATNVLLLGLDSRAGLSEAEIDKYHLGHDGVGGSDTMMLVHLSPARDHATIISFPRDLYVTIPKFTRADGKTLGQVQLKLNAAFPRGGEGVGGPALTMITLENLTGLHIDHYMSIDVPHLGRMVNALGGVDVCLPKAVNDTMFEGRPGGSGLVLSAGKHKLTDAQAVAYVRMRHVDTGEGSSDFGRIRRQQKFLASMLKKVTSAGTLLNMTKLKGFLHTVADAVTMDNEMSTNDLLTMATQLRSLDPKHVTFVTVPVADDDHRVPGVGSTVIADEAAAQALYTAIREDKVVGANDFKNDPDAVKPSDVSVQVLNGGAPTGSAGRAAGELTAMGFTSGGPTGNADTRDYEATTVKYPTQMANQAKTLLKAVPGAQLVADDSLSTVTLILGKDFKGTTPIPAATTPPKAIVTHSAADDLCK